MVARLPSHVALLSLGSCDRLINLCTETVQALAVYTLLRTDQNDWIKIKTDGERLWVEVERSPVAGR